MKCHAGEGGTLFKQERASVAVIMAGSKTEGWQAPAWLVAEKRTS